ncbi:MAG: preprotein translocase subunit SecG [Granulosicoccus sp.]|nr:preprotein translocase subunit SecG [Granulosicoccus sp.]
MQSLALVIHVALAVAVIVLVLVQHGKGAEAGAAFGSGASSTVFGARGSASFLTRVTTVLAALFFLTSLSLFYIAAHREGGISSVTDLPSLQESASESESDLPAVPGSDTPAASGSESDLPAVPGSEDTPAAPGSESDLPSAPD